MYPVYMLETPEDLPKSMRENVHDFDQAFLDRLDKAWEEWTKIQIELEKIVEQQQE